MSINGTKCDLLNIGDGNKAIKDIYIDASVTVRNVAGWGRFADGEPGVELSLADDFVLGPLRIKRIILEGNEEGEERDVGSIDVPELYHALHGNGHEPRWV